MDRTKKIRELSNTGLTLKEIMPLVGIEHYTTIYRICVRNDININKKRGRPIGSRDKQVRKSRNYVIVDSVEPDAREKTLMSKINNSTPTTY